MSLLASVNKMVVRDDNKTDPNYEKQGNADETTSSKLPGSTTTTSQAQSTPTLSPAFLPGKLTTDSSLTNIAEEPKNPEESSSSTTTTPAPAETPAGSDPLPLKVDASSTTSSSSLAPPSTPTVAPAGQPPADKPPTTGIPAAYSAVPTPNAKSTPLSDSIYNNIIASASTLSTVTRSSSTPVAYQIPTNYPSAPLAMAATTPLSTPTIAPTSSSPSNNTMKVAVPVAAGVGSFVVLGGLGLAMSMRYRRGKWPFKNNEAFVEMRDDVRDDVRDDDDKIDVEKRQRAKWDPSRSHDRISRFIQRAR
ncbi:hypothetical protein Cpir12675_006699 [Ceratocystis pirilliformis]|uniref:Uncharacterized protein n=1 Tax=Ceratocystis pirilliformis TaxID=259994 RepID=A0ABR3YFL5_9PEZI